MWLKGNLFLFITNLHSYLQFLQIYFKGKIIRFFYRFETGKDKLVDTLVSQRGKYVRPFLHTSMIGLFLIGLMLAPLIKGAFPEKDFTGSTKSLFSVLGISSLNEATQTEISVKPRDSVVSYTIQLGDTLSSIALKFGVNEETVLWQNDLDKKSILKPGQKLEIPPVTGVVHKVKRGDTIYSIAKTYNVDAQQIINWPFNAFTNDETFALAVGQVVIVPDGIKPKPKEAPSPKYLATRFKQTPSAGAVSATGDFVWPTSGSLTQYFVWYHQAVDIANNSAPDILAADSGTVVLVRYDRYAYGFHVMIDHGNGYVTLYGHMQAIYVTEGQTVARGSAIGRMGSTGRSSGTHLHFEIRLNGINQNPLNYLK